MVDPDVVDALLAAETRTSPIDRLTRREKEILALMAQGWSNTALCDRLYLGPKKVETHIGRIFTTLELAPAPEGHRRVLAVLAYLSAPSGDQPLNSTR